jgi:DNA helicase IV
MDDESVRMLAKSWGEQISVDDVALLDELRYLLGDPPIVNTGSVDDEYLGAEDASLHEVFTASDREYAGPRGWTPPTNRVEDDAFAHVLVDEAQDLTPMQWRMVGRRGRGATWTIVGDPAQSSWPVPSESAAAREEALGEKQRHDFHLSTNYRNSSEIYDFAAAYASRVGLDADLPDAVRSNGVAPSELRVDDLEASVRSALGELAGSLEGTVGVVVPAARLGEVTRWVSSWPEYASEFGSPDSRLVVLTGLDTKGLEFDGIVVVQPQEIEDESTTGRATLYVVYTRATQRMVTLTA